MARNFQTTTTHVDARASQVLNIMKNAGRSVKSTFDRRRWKDGMVLAILAVDFTHDENDLAEALSKNPLATAEDIAKDLRVYPVFKTALIDSAGDQHPYDDLWLSTTIRSVEDAEGDEHTPSGTFNVLCQEKFNATNTDEETLNAIFSALDGKHIKVRREKQIKRDYYGRTRTEKLLEFDIAQSPHLNLVKGVQFRLNFLFIFNL